MLFALVVLLATVTTAVLSLDTTAVLLTPVVLVICEQVGVARLPFALATVWLANTASLFLPVSNLTNLLAADRLGGHPLVFARHALPPALACVMVTVVALVLVGRRDLTGRHPAAASAVPGDPALFGAAVLAVAGFTGAVPAGAAVAVAASVAAGALGAVFAVRDRPVLREVRPAWAMAVSVAALFIVVAAAQRHGLAPALADVAGRGGSGGELLRLAAVGALAGNLVNNLPAYLALEGVATGADRTLALLVGVNCGVLLTPWGSLATLLWWQRCAALGVVVPVRRFVGLGLLLVPALLLTGVGALLLG